MSKTVAEAVTEELKPAQFDLAAWIKGTTRVVKRVTVYGRPDIALEIEELDGMIRDFVAPDVPTSKRLVKPDPADDPRQAWARRVDELRAEMEETAVEFRFQSLSSSEVRAISSQFGDDSDESGYALFAAQCVRPEGMTAEGFKELEQHMGFGPFMRTIGDAANAARDGIQVSIPFSPHASLLTRTKE